MDERLDASVKRILQQNRRIAQELQLHMEESETLQRENKIMEEERKRLLQVWFSSCGSYSALTVYCRTLPSLQRRLTSPGVKTGLILNR